MLLLCVRCSSLPQTLTPATSPDQVRPSPAKLPHQLSPLGTNAHQASPSQPVVLSPVKLAPSALPGAFSAAAAAALSPDSAPRRSLRGARAQRQAEQAQQQAQQQQQEMQQASLPAQQQEMQLFLATTADGQQLLLRAPAGTDPQSLIAPDGSVQSCYLAAVIPNTPLASPGASGAGVAAGAAQQQRTLITHHHQQQQEHCSPVGRSMRQALQVDLPPMFSSPSKVMMSPGDPRAKEAAGLLRCSPGRTVFSPKGSSPSKPILGQSPGRSQGSHGY